MNEITRAIRNAIANIDNSDPHARDRIYAAARKIVASRIESQMENGVSGNSQKTLAILENSIAEIEGEFALEDAMFNLDVVPISAVDSKPNSVLASKGNRKYGPQIFAAIVVVVGASLAWFFKSDIHSLLSGTNDKPSQELTDKKPSSQTNAESSPLLEFTLSDGNSTKPFVVKGRGSVVKSSGSDDYVSLHSIREANRPNNSAKPILLRLGGDVKKIVANGTAIVTIKAKSGRSEDTNLYVSCVFHALAKCKYEKFTLNKNVREFSYIIETKKMPTPNKRLFILLGTDPGRKNDENEGKVGTADIFSIKLSYLPNSSD